MCRFMNKAQLSSCGSLSGPSSVQRPCYSCRTVATLANSLMGNFVLWRKTQTAEREMVQHAIKSFGMSIPYVAVTLSVSGVSKRRNHHH